MDGQKELLGMWIAQTEGEKFWLSVMTELKNRGVQDILVTCVDSLKGFREAIASVYPHTDKTAVYCPCRAQQFTFCQLERLQSSDSWFKTVIYQMTSAFKTVGRLREVEQDQTRADVEIRRLTGIVGQSVAMLTVIDQIARLSMLDLPVLIIGEAGTGRMMAARSLHVVGRRGGTYIQLQAAEVNRALEKVLLGTSGYAAGKMHPQKIQVTASRYRHKALLWRENGTIVIDNVQDLSVEALSIIQDWGRKGECWVKTRRYQVRG